MTKRLFVSTKYSKLLNALPNASEVAVDIEKRNILKEEIKNINVNEICHWNSSNHKIEEGFDNDSDLFFIKDDLNSLSSNILINKNEDYLLWHSEKTNAAIINKFDLAKTKEGHHGGLKHGQENFRYYAIVLDTLIHDKNATAETIIQKIWPDLEAREELPSLVHQRIGISEESDILKFVEKLNDYCNNYPKNDKTTQP